MSHTNACYNDITNFVTHVHVRKELYCTMASFSTDSDEVEDTSSRRCFNQVASPFRVAIAKCAEIAPCKFAPVRANGPYP